MQRSIKRPIAARARLPHPCWRPAGFLVGGWPSARCGLQTSTALAPRPYRREGAAPTPLLAACWLSCGRVALGPMRPVNKHSPCTKALSPRGRGSHIPATAARFLVGGSPRPDLLNLLWERRPRRDAAVDQASHRRGARLPHHCLPPGGLYGRERLPHRAADGLLDFWWEGRPRHHKASPTIRACLTPPSLLAAPFVNCPMS